ncbi:predicted protein [Naegleria gruberi]|uniref:Predicted protein n=1 Tax=Naegleria gruberi TaxID=5762 RepID=D2VLM5_NAEGR|nr:uncharacterized protein NAEGRDRAFT_69834 [Naegleria gruberi]EFC42417.1 predicted protein [Naegleria gruberi]|eukprot:XP_002675161.1 predicted protein [Naegleria gruberi strain NEG-M]
MNRKLRLGIILFILALFLLACFAVCLVIIIVPSVIFGRQNINIYPDPVYTASDDYLHFLVVGDQGRANADQVSVAKSMGDYCDRVKKCSFVIGVGDNIYDYGVGSATDEQFATKFENIYSQYNGTKNLPWKLMLGNHDYRNNPNAQIQYKSSLWDLPAYYYIFNKTSTLGGFNVSFVVTDTNTFQPDSLMNQQYVKEQSAFKQDQLNMIESVLKENYGKTNTWSIVLGHHPVYSAGIHGDTTTLIENYLPLFKKYKLPLYLSGHDHFLNWLKDPNEVTNYVISGGGAGNTRPTVYNKYSSNVYNDSGFFAVEIQKSFIYMIAMDKNGKELYKIKIDKP